MKPAWDSLSETYEGSSSVVIADVDCTTDGGKPVCEEYGVRGYPTIKYFTPDTPKTGEDYNGGRTLEALKKFAEDTLDKKCTIAEPADCDEKEVEYIAKMQAKEEGSAAKELMRLEGMKGGSMKPEMKGWLNKRISILKQM